MAFFILRSFSLGLISQKGIFRSPNYCGRMMSSMRVNSGDSSVDCSSSLASRAWPPWLMLAPAWDNNNNMVYKLYSLADNKVVSLNKRCAGKGKEDESEELESPDDDALIVGSSHGWLALFNERNCDLFLSNPLTRRHIKLPPIHALPIPQENLRGVYGCVSKVIISCSPHEEECRAMMTLSRFQLCEAGNRTN